MGDAQIYSNYNRENKQQSNFWALDFQTPSWGTLLAFIIKPCLNHPFPLEGTFEWGKTW
jgi:hypothetical protein